MILGTWKCVYCNWENDEKSATVGGAVACDRCGQKQTESPGAVAGAAALRAAVMGQGLGSLGATVAAGWAGASEVSGPRAEVNLGGEDSRVGATKSVRIQLRGIAVGHAARVGIVAQIRRPGSGQQAAEPSKRKVYWNGGESQIPPVSLPLDFDGFSVGAHPVDLTVVVADPREPAQWCAYRCYEWEIYHDPGLEASKRAGEALAAAGTTKFKVRGSTAADINVQAGADVELGKDFVGEVHIGSPASPSVAKTKQLVSLHAVGREGLSPSVIALVDKGWLQTPQDPSPASDDPVQRVAPPRAAQLALAPSKSTGLPFGSIRLIAGERLLLGRPLGPDALPAPENYFDFAHSATHDGGPDGKHACSARAFVIERGADGGGFRIRTEAAANQKWAWVVSGSVWQATVATGKSAPLHSAAAPVDEVGLVLRSGDRVMFQAINFLHGSSSRSDGAAAVCFSNIPLAFRVAAIWPNGLVLKRESLQTLGNPREAVETVVFVDRVGLPDWGDRDSESEVAEAMPYVWVNNSGAFVLQDPGALANLDGAIHVTTTQALHKVAAPWLGGDYHVQSDACSAATNRARPIVH